ncbi:MAG: hypothetical protein V3T77_06520, partial [Planctomycetota bacterium]
YNLLPSSGVGIPSWIESRPPCSLLPMSILELLHHRKGCASGTVESALHRSGNPRTRAELTLPGGAQIAQFLDEEGLFEAFFRTHPGSFQGTVNIRVKDSGRVSLLGLLQKSTGALVVVGTSPVAFGPD